MPKYQSKAKHRYYYYVVNLKRVKFISLNVSVLCTAMNTYGIDVVVFFFQIEMSERKNDNKTC